MQRIYQYVDPFKKTYQSFAEKRKVSDNLLCTKVLSLHDDTLAIHPAQLADNMERVLVLANQLYSGPLNY